MKIKIAVEIDHDTERLSANYLEEDQTGVNIWARRTGEDEGETPDRYCAYDSFGGYGEHATFQDAVADAMSLIATHLDTSFGLNPPTDISG